jgi:hypothetical protein
MFDGTTTTRLSSTCQAISLAPLQQPQPFVNNGWVVYNTTVSGVATLSRRSPGGVFDFPAAFTDSIFAVGINPQGEVLLGRIGNGTLYQASPGAGPKLLGTVGSRTLWAGQRWFHLVADTLYQVNAAGDPPSPGTDPGPSPQTDAGVGDGGTGDAAVPVDMPVIGDAGELDGGERESQDGGVANASDSGETDDGDRADADMSPVDEQGPPLDADLRPDTAPQEIDAGSAGARPDGSRGSAGDGCSAAGSSTRQMPLSWLLLGLFMVGRRGRRSSKGS